MTHHFAPGQDYFPARPLSHSVGLAIFESRHGNQAGVNGREPKMFAEFYESKEATTHGTGYCAFYMGRNSVWYGTKKAERAAFKSEADYRRYLDGRRSAQAEERLDADTEWDGDEGY